jgi:hypothetical protein
MSELVQDLVALSSPLISFISWENSERRKTLADKPVDPTMIRIYIWQYET